jgi:hypothetical protein
MVGMGFKAFRDVLAMIKDASLNVGGILGDDIAASTNITNGIKADRELPIIKEIVKGSLKNKLIIIPSVLAASVIAPPLIPITLTAGGVFLSYEATESLKEMISGEDEHKKEDIKPKNEKEIIKDSIKLDGILSLEIVIMALSTVVAAPVLIQAGVVGVVGVAATAGVYGTVAGIVRMDDVGLELSKSKNKLISSFGNGLVKAMPKVIDSLEIIGLGAMAAVGGSILAHHIPMVHHLVEMTEHLPSILPTVSSMGIEMVTSGIIGGMTIGGIKLLEPVIDKIKSIFPQKDNNEKNPQKSNENNIDNNNLKKSKTIDNDEPKKSNSIEIDDNKQEKSKTIDNDETSYQKTPSKPRKIQKIEIDGEEIKINIGTRETNKSFLQKIINYLKPEQEKSINNGINNDEIQEIKSKKDTGLKIGN